MYTFLRLSWTLSAASSSRRRNRRVNSLRRYPLCREKPTSMKALRLRWTRAFYEWGNRGHYRDCRQSASDWIYIHIYLFIKEKPYHLQKGEESEREMEEGKKTQSKTSLYKLFSPRFSPLYFHLLFLPPDISSRDIAGMVSQVAGGLPLSLHRRVEQCIELARKCFVLERKCQSLEEQTSALTDEKVKRLDRILCPERSQASYTYIGISPLVELGWR